MSRSQKAFLITALVLLGTLFVGAAFLLGDHLSLEKTLALINNDLSPLLFVSLMIVLPILGFPISVFLVITGIKFGIFSAVLLWFLVLPVHALLGYAAARYLSPILKKLLNNVLGYKVPIIPAQHEAMFSLFFLAIPGIPYAAKNYLLPLAGVSVRYCVVMNCLVQSLLGLPFIILGKSGAEMNPSLFSIAIALLACFILVLNWLKKKYTKK